LKADIFFLASDECEGRGPNTAGFLKAGDHIATEFKKAGLKPGNPDGTYFQNFTINGALLEGQPELALKGPDGKALTLKQGADFDVLGYSLAGKLDAARVVFAGYGITSSTYDDYENLDVADKVVIVLRDIPRTGDTKQFSASSAFRANGEI